MDWRKRRGCAGGGARVELREGEETGKMQTLISHAYNFLCIVMLHIVISVIKSPCGSNKIPWVQTFRHSCNKKSSYQQFREKEVLIRSPPDIRRLNFKL